MVHKLRSRHDFEGQQLKEAFWGRVHKCFYKMLAPDEMAMVCDKEKLLMNEVPTSYHLDSSIII